VFMCKRIRRYLQEISLMWIYIIIMVGVSSDSNTGVYYQMLYVCRMRCEAKTCCFSNKYNKLMIVQIV
jgi:hypothetical protein